MKILIINSGSSSLKFKLFTTGDLTLLASGIIEQIGAAESHSQITCYDAVGKENISKQREPVADHRLAIATMSFMLQESGAMTDIRELAGIGHRVVHGGENFNHPVLIDDQVIAAIEELIPLAPLHNPANLLGIRVARELAGTIPQVAVFDTAFHQSIPEHSFLYALPYSIYEEQKVRRYGFHGTSHAYVIKKAAEYLSEPLEKLNIISLHLGNGASAAAIKGGKCIDTSMGMTPLEGLIMGTRSGDIDPAILFYLAREKQMSLDDLDILLNSQSGLKGICGEQDMRTITDLARQGDRLAGLALTMFCYRLKKYIGSYLAALGTVDVLIFTGGIGENADGVRQQVCDGLSSLGMDIDQERNQQRNDEIMTISPKGASVRILVVPTNEEREIAIQTSKVLSL